MTDPAEDLPSGTYTAEGSGPEEIPYVRDGSPVEAAAGMVDRAYGETRRWWGEVGEHLRAQAAELGLEAETPLVRELAYAASYVLRTDPGGKAGCALRPLTDNEVHAWPPRIAEVSPDVVSLWRDLAGCVRHPAARARFSDLLFERRDGVGRDRAVTAATAYLEAARTRPQADLDVTQVLLRAWELARRIRAWPILAEACTELARHAEAELSRSQPQAGIVLPMLAALAARPARGQEDQAPQTILDPAAVRQLLEMAFTAFKPGFQASRVASIMRASTSDAAEIEQINRREIGAYLTQAAASTGLSRQAHLQDAIRIAHDRGLTDLVRQITADLQAIPPKDLGMHKFSWSVRLPTGQVKRFLDRFVSGPDWRDGLGFFLLTGCPVGDLGQLRQEVRDTAALTVFLNATSRTILGKDGLPRYTTASDDDKLAAQEATYACTRAEIHGQALAGGLRRMPDRYGIPGESQVAAFLSHDGRSDESLALSLARSFRHYWQDDYEACVHVVTPKIEAAARALLRELDEGIYRVQVAKEPGQYPGLYVLLQELEKLGLDESWAYFLRWLLLGPFGINIRNEIAHGFVTHTGPVYAALILRAAALLITLAGPQPPAAVLETGKENDQAADLIERPRRDRDDLLRLLATPIGAPVPLPLRDGIGGRLTAFTASSLRTAASTLNLLARRLDP